MHGKPRGWYTVWSGKVSKTYLIHSSPGAQVRHSSHFTNNLPIWRISTFNLLFRIVCNLSGGWTGRGGTNERLALGFWTGTCHSNFQSGRRINQRLSLLPRTRIGPEAILQFWGQLPKNELKNGAQGHCKSKTCRLINDNYHPKIYWGKATKRMWKQGRIAGNSF